MAGNTTQNTSAVIKGQVYSDIILETLQDGFLPDSLMRDVTDFGNGETLFIPTVGETVIHDYVEDQPVKYDPVDTGQVTLRITDYKQAGTYVTDKLKQDAYALQAVESQIPSQHLYKIQESYETGLLATANDQVIGDLNEINSQPHRFVAQSTNQVLTMADFVQMRLSFQKANVPEQGWIAIVDPITEAALNQQLGNAVYDSNPELIGLYQTGFAKNHKFLRNIMGFDVWVSNRLPRIDSETIDGSTVENGVANIFMSVGDDMAKPMMGAWRQMPRTVGDYNKDYFRDEYVTSARWGFGLQRKDTLGVVISSASNYK